MAKGIKRKDLKELREPDEFLSISQRAIDYATAHERQVTAAVLAVVTLIAVALGVRQYRASQRAGAEEAFATAYRSFADGKFEAAAGEFRRVHEDWPSTDAAHLARVFEGNAYAELGKKAEAQEAFRSVLGTEPPPLIAQIAHHNLGQLVKQSGDAAGAARELGEAVRIEGPLRASAWLSRLTTRQPFEEMASVGMKALQELPPEAKAFVESRTRAKGEVAAAGGSTAAGGEPQAVLNVR